MINCAKGQLYRRMVLYYPFATFHPKRISQITHWYRLQHFEFTQRTSWLKIWSSFCIISQQNQMHKYAPRWICSRLTVLFHHIRVSLIKTRIIFSFSLWKRLRDSKRKRSFKYWFCAPAQWGQPKDGVCSSAVISTVWLLSVIDWLILVDWETHLFTSVNSVNSHLNRSAFAIIYFDFISNTISEILQSLFR